MPAMATTGGMALFNVCPFVGSDRASAFSAGATSPRTTIRPRLGGTIPPIILSSSVFHALGGTTSARQEPLYACRETLSTTLRVEDIDAKTLRSAFKNPVVLAVQTDQWSLTSVDLSSRYGVTYAATARIVRTTDGTVLSNARCRLDGKEFVKLTMDELKADNGAQLKTRLGQTADLCVERLIGELLSPELVSAAASTK